MSNMDIHQLIARTLAKHIYNSCLSNTEETISANLCLVSDAILFTNFCPKLALSRVAIRTEL